MHLLQLRSGLELLQCIDAAAYLDEKGYQSKVLRFEAQQRVPMWAAYGHRDEDILAACMPLR